MLALGGCGGRESYATSYDLRWVGTVTPEAGRCPPASQATLTLTRRDRAVAFAPNEGVIVLHGSLGANGTVEAALDPGAAGRHPFPLRFTGTIAPDGVTGLYTSPICRAHVELHPPKPLPHTLFSPGNLLGIGNP